MYVYMAMMGTQQKHHHQSSWPEAAQQQHLNTNGPCISNCNWKLEKFSLFVLCYYCIHRGLTEWNSESTAEAAAAVAFDFF